MVILVFGGMSFLLISGEDIDNMLVKFTVFAVGIVRLVPCANRITWAITTIRYGIPSMDEVVSQIKISEKCLVNLQDERFAKKMKFEDRIELKSVTYLYENTANPSCDSISLSIRKNSCVGLVGSTGAGKTTISNLITGLLNPLKGEVLVDGQNIQSQLRSWQVQIGYVPQSIYLMDDTIQGNVAFGVNRENVKENKVWEALKLAQVDNFVRDLPNQLDTVVGENGVRLSGGQRQRIGIARALYRDPQLLVLDEATAALDNETERALMDAIETLSGKKTIILIAHRLTTVKRCDVVFYLDNGQLIDSGTHESLLRKNADFKKMAQA
jgi:ATP-binding cassette subfamily C protein